MTLITDNIAYESDWELAQITSGHLAITTYLGDLVRSDKTPKKYKDELVSLTHLMLGTCGVKGQDVGYLCADRACRRFASRALLVVDQLAAWKMRTLVKVTCPHTAELAYKTTTRAAEAFEAATQNHYLLQTALRSLVGVLSVSPLYAASNSAFTAIRSESWPEAVQLFKDLCDLPRENK